MDRPLDIVLGLIVAALIIALVLFARGEPGHGDPSPTSGATAAVEWLA